MNSEISIVIADDHPIFRSGLSQLLKLEKNINILGEAENGVEALQLIHQTNPSVAILDIDMPEKGGFEVARELIAAKTPTEMIFLTMHKNETLFNAALDLGVRGFVLKDSAMEDILQAVKTVIADKSFISPDLNSFLIKRLQLGENSRNNNQIETLTATERRILLLISEYQTSREIAEKLYISVRTVERHRENISSKLNLRGNKTLLKFALENKEKILHIASL